MGLLIWSLLTRSSPYDKFTTFPEFYHAICEENHRPTIPEETLPCIKNLIERCWHVDPAVRPSCNEIVQTFYHILIEVAMSDPNGIEFWKKYCLDKTAVYWDEFSAQFVREYVLLPKFPSDKQLKDASSCQLGEYAYRNELCKASVETEWKRRESSKPLPSIDELKNYLIYLKSLISSEENKQKIVQLETFGKLLAWFGPIKEENGKSIFLERVCYSFGGNSVFQLTSGLDLLI